MRALSRFAAALFAAMLVSAATLEQLSLDEMSQKSTAIVRAKVADTFFLRPPHWAPRAQVGAFVGASPVPVVWSGDYVRFDDVRSGDEVSIAYPLVAFRHRVSGLWRRTRPDLALTFEWLGNMVVGCDAPAGPTPLFTGRPRRLPPPPALQEERSR